MQQSFQGERALGYQQITLSNVTPSSLTIPPSTVLILVQAEAQPIRWRDDKVAPTASVGYNIAVGGELRYTAGNMASLQLIGTATGAIANVVFYGAVGAIS